jgi:hypothetical protein
MGTPYKIIKIQPAVTAADNDDNDVVFDWTEIPNFSSGRGMAALLESVALMDRNDTGPGSVSFDLFFCRGSYVNNTASAPTSAQRLGAADAVVDITGAEAKAIEICGHINMTSTEGDLLTGSVVTKSNIGLVLEPHPGSTSIYVAGVYRFNPADTSTGSDATDGLDFYFGFKS